MPRQPIAENGLLSLAERRTLQGLYTSGPSAFGSLTSLKKASGLSKEKVSAFLHGKNAYTKFRIAHRKFQRLRVVTTRKNHIWCADLAFVDKLASKNDGVRYIFLAIDIFSRFVYVEPMKTKEAVSAKGAFMKILSKSGNQPEKLWTDDETEFQGVFKKYCKTLGIHIYQTFSDKKAVFAERAIRSLKNIMYRYMEERDTYRYLPKLQSFAVTMNSRVNRSIAMAPKDVKNVDALRLIHMQKPLKYKKPKFKVGDNVRISRKEIAFNKGYKAQFTNEIFRIAKVFDTIPPTYELEDKDKEIISGKFYESELVLYTS